MEKVLHFFKSTMTVPLAWGTFHWVAVASVIVITFLLCLFFRNADNKVFRLVLIIIWAIMFTMEVIKQVEEAAHFNEDGTLYWAYNWSTFPLQLCDSPLWFLLPVACLKEGKVRDLFIAYVSTYVLLGGLATYSFPQTTFGPTAYVNVQTMVHHGLQIASSVLIAVHYKEKIKKLSFFLNAIPVFVGFVIVATIFNVAAHAAVPNMEINMCYISPYFRKTVPIEAVNGAFQKMHWLAVIFFYIGALTVLAFIIYMIYYGIFHLIERRSKAPAKN